MVCHWLLAKAKLLLNLELLKKQMPWQYLLLIPTTLFHLILSWRSRKIPPPGKLFDLGGYRVHLWSKGTGNTTVVLDHSLGGIEGYFLLDAIA